MCSVVMYALYFACVGFRGEEVKAMCIGSCIIPEAGYTILRRMFSHISVSTSFSIHLSYSIHI